jgi:hypothetical protein
MNTSRETIVTTLFARKEHLYSLLWWSDSDANIINAHSFIINGHDSVPIFASESEAKEQLAGSGYEKDLVGIDPGLLAAILQGKGYAILNPRGPNPIQFRTSILAPCARVPGA